MSSSPAPAPSTLVWRLPRLIAETSMCAAKIYGLLDPKSPYYDPAFPRPIRLGNGKRGAVGWLASEVHEWLISRPRAC
ncbi:MAG: AlpA family phage regulatory protein [Proteobacteria bacterium]|nr:AlpA family phage regulatory protein [Pseudomonadota bacterium]